MSNFKKIAPVLFLILFGSIFYLFTLRGVWGDAKPYSGEFTSHGKPFESSHERSTFVLMLSFLEKRNFVLSQKYADFASPDVGIKNGNYYSFFPPGVALYILPFYQLGHKYNLAQVSAYGSMIILSVASLILIFFISRDIIKLPSNLSIFNSLVFGFASTFWPYAIDIYQHSMTTFLLLLSFYSVWRYSLKNRFSWFWAILVWFCYGISIFVDYPNLALFAPIIIYFLIISINLWKEESIYKINFRSTFLVTSVFFVGLVVLHMFYNYKTFGNWKTVSNVLPRYVAGDISNINKTPSEIEKQNAKPASLSLLKEERLVRNLSELIYLPDKGILTFSPIFILSIFGVWVVRKKIALEIAVMMTVILVNLWLYASFGDPYGGWAFGPRYLIPAAAFLSLFVGLAINYLKPKWVIKVFAFLLFGLSSAIALLGAITSSVNPPEVEASYNKLRYGVLFNWDFFQKGKTGVFLYNNFLRNTLNLYQYYGVIWISLLAVIFITLISKSNND